MVPKRNKSCDGFYLSVMPIYRISKIFGLSPFTIKLNSGGPLFLNDLSSLAYSIFMLIIVILSYYPLYVMHRNYLENNSYKVILLCDLFRTIGGFSTSTLIIILSIVNRTKIKELFENFSSLDYGFSSLGIVINYKDFSTGLTKVLSLINVSAFCFLITDCVAFLGHRESITFAHVYWASCFLTYFINEMIVLIFCTCVYMIRIRIARLNEHLVFIQKSMEISSTSKKFSIRRNEKPVEVIDKEKRLIRTLKTYPVYTQVNNKSITPNRVQLLKSKYIQVKNKSLPPLRKSCRSHISKEQTRPNTHLVKASTQSVKNQKDKFEKKYFANQHRIFVVGSVDNQNAVFVKGLDKMTREEMFVKELTRNETEKLVEIDNQKRKFIKESVDDQEEVSIEGFKDKEIFLTESVENGEGEFVKRLINKQTGICVERSTKNKDKKFTEWLVENQTDTFAKKSVDKEVEIFVEEFDDNLKETFEEGLITRQKRIFAKSLIGDQIGAFEHELVSVNELVRYDVVESLNHNETLSDEPVNNQNGTFFRSVDNKKEIFIDDAVACTTTEFQNCRIGNKITTASSEIIKVQTDYGQKILLSQITILSNAYDQIHGLVQSVNSLFSKQILCFIGIIFSFTMVSIYYFYKLWDPKKDLNGQLKDCWAALSWGIVFQLFIYPICFMCTKVKKEAEKTKLLLRRIKFIANTKNILRKVQMFSIQIDHQNMDFSACGFFTIDVSVLHLMFATVSTYLVFLIQFDMSGEISCP